MGKARTGRFKVGPWMVDPDLGVIQRDEPPVTLRPREMDLLVYLARTKGQVVSADDLIENVWAGGSVANDSIYFSISQLRKALGDDPTQPSFIETVPKRGYRLVAAVEFVEQQPGSEAERVEDKAGSMGNGDRKWLVAAVVGVLAIVVLVGSLRFSSDPVIEPSLPTVSEKSIAVMPFVDLSPGGDQEYFSDGIAEEILNNLSAVPGLLVAARTSSFSYKGREPAVQEIGEALGVTTILEGSVRKEGDRVRVAAQLIDTQNGFRLWNETFERELSGVLDIQDEISRAIVAELQVELTSAGAAVDQPAPRAIDRLAYDSYLRGLQAFRISSFDSLRRALGYYEAAIGFDPSFTQAYNELARTKIALWLTGATSDPALLEQAREHAREVLERDPDNGNAYRSLGIVAYESGELAQSVDLLKRARELSPNDPLTLIELATGAYMSGEKEKADSWFQQAVRYDPLNWHVYHKQGCFFRDMGRFQESVASFETAIGHNPGNPSLRGVLGLVHILEAGNLAAGIRDFQQGATLDPEDPEGLTFPALAYLSLGAPELADPLINRAFTLDPDRPFAKITRAVQWALAGRLADAAELVKGGEGRMRMPLTFNPHTLAMIIVVNDALERGDYQAAEDYLLAKRFRLRKTLEAPPVQSYGDFQTLRIPAEWLLLLAHLYKETNRSEELPPLMERIAATRLPTLQLFRSNLRNIDFVLEAQALAVEGKLEESLDRLEQGVEKGFRYNWQVYLLLNPVFSELRDHPRFQALVENIRADTSAQLATLQSAGQYADVLQLQ